jgi:rhamnosyltransferase
MIKTSMPSQIIAVVPVYNPDASFLARLKTLTAQVEGVIVVDDGSFIPFKLTDDYIPARVALVSQSNQGIAAAINTGIRCARQRWPKLDYVLTLDQDSHLEKSYVEEALRIFEGAKKPE